MTEPLAAPLPELVGEVGGIESMVVDGRRWFFGFSYTSDLVLTPLIADPGAMARFASEFMRQADGTHDPAYWLELVEDSVADSGLTGNDEDRVVDTAALAREPALSYHLRYVLDAATGWQDDAVYEEPDVVAAFATIGVARSRHDVDGLDQVVAALSGEHRAAAELILRRYVAEKLDHLPGNWPEVFAGLRP
ncbi:hypothetical protein Daura_13490 [Dactylosporangium aurantiacum]|uniref:Uncharacterized protein n=1 Tax=Dactylosporangium aurantiacum TaxID=35754 RepID=A0A9Q9MHT2_9ACTN|nr:hypothetical protein [Dactylosporangium aurantiacum]MDG6105574.1 hypothetical protein [Dactylosporangium aurantiacum]UWZ57084.1 hypothetical protein Daura_13490 [Dactylosporangium aurantiacum]